VLVLGPFPYGSFIPGNGLETKREPKELMGIVDSKRFAIYESIGWYHISPGLFSDPDL